MKLISFLFVSLGCLVTGKVANALETTNDAKSKSPYVFDERMNVTYQGLNRNNIEIFLNIRFGQDTSGSNRFKPPRPFMPGPGSTIEVQEYGPACPQSPNSYYATNVSEDCLSLNVARPAAHTSVRSEQLPVLVWIFGGGLILGSNQNPATAPDALIAESVENGTPIIHVAINYRLGVFGFAQSDALKSEGSTNAGLRDQRLAIEWVRDNIAAFGGDPKKITIFGQSSGGLAVGMQIMAYGGSQPVPFQQAICESQALEPGVTSNFTINAMQFVADYVGCNQTSLDSKDTVSCLRSSDLETLLNASIASNQLSALPNLGDIWLPFVDGDFLPEAPSQLIQQGRFARVTTMMGWCQDDLVPFMDPTIETASDVRDSVKIYAPGFRGATLDRLLSLYPSTDFIGDQAANLSAEYFRTARIIRDILMVCEPFYYSEKLAAMGSTTYLYDWNQTNIGPFYEALVGYTGVGIPHGSDLVYVYDNLINKTGIILNPTASDFALGDRASRTWAAFATNGRPGNLEGHDTFQGFKAAFPSGTGGLDEPMYVFVAGGPSEGLSTIDDGPGANPDLVAQNLKERCAFINSADVIQQLAY